jgi:outer membrane protein assembly factor BamD
MRSAEVAAETGFVGTMVWSSLNRSNSTWRLRAMAVARAFALVLALTPLAGCESLGGLFGKNDEIAPEEPADLLYNEGLFLLNNKGDPKGAAKKFEEVDRQHPYSDWARKALIMTAFAFYQAGDYENAIGAARRYITLHPGSADAPYAQYLIGASYFDRIPDISRDQDRTEKAVTSLDEVVRKYPNSEYAVAAKRKIDVAKDSLAGKEIMIGRNYMESRNFIGAINRFKVVVTRYQTTRHVEEALMRLTEAYMSLGIVEEAQTSAAVLGHNFPDSRWYKDAYALVQSRGLEPSENKSHWISQAFKKFSLVQPG